MRLLMVYCWNFSYKTSQRGLESVKEFDEEKEFENALVGFIHVDPQDIAQLSDVVTKLIKNLKWTARKNKTQQFVLHSFAHLAESKANLEDSKQILDLAQERLRSAGYTAEQTPFGYFIDLQVNAHGNFFARLY